MGIGKTTAIGADVLGKTGDRLEYANLESGSEGTGELGASSVSAYNDPQKVPVELDPNKSEGGIGQLLRFRHGHKHHHGPIGDPMPKLPGNPQDPMPKLPGNPQDPMPRFPGHSGPFVPPIDHKPFPNWPPVDGPTTGPVGLPGNPQDPMPRFPPGHSGPFIPPIDHKPFPPGTFPVPGDGGVIRGPIIVDHQPFPPGTFPVPGGGGVIHGPINKIQADSDEGRPVIDGPVISGPIIIDRPNLPPIYTADSSGPQDLQATVEASRLKYDPAA